MEFVIGEAVVRKVDFIDPRIDEECLLIATEGFGQSRGDLAKTVGQHIREGELYVAYQNGQPAGFRILQNPSEGVAYLAGAIKRPGVQKHLIRDMTKQLLVQKQSNVVITRSGSDFVLDEMLHLCANVFPYNGKMTMDPVGYLSSVNLAGIVTDNTNRDNLFIPGCYGSSMVNRDYGRPRSRNPYVSGFMRNTISDEEYFSGGAIVFIGNNLR